MKTHWKSSPRSLPLGAVDMAWFTVSLLVGVFKDHFLPSHHALRTGWNTVWSILHFSTCNTLVCSLQRRGDRLIDKSNMSGICRERNVLVANDALWHAFRWQKHSHRKYRKSYRAGAGLLPLLDLTLRVAWHTLPWLRGKLPPLPAFRVKKY